MSDLPTYVGQIEIFAFDFAPVGWAKCDGQLLSINANKALFSVLGTTFGGDGMNTFALPDLRGRVAIGQGAGPGLTGRVVGDTTGEETNTLTDAAMPAHSHGLTAQPNTLATQNTEVPSGVLAKAYLVGESSKATDLPIYVANAAPGVKMAADAIAPCGAGAPHPNIMPYLTLNVCIALDGKIPPQDRAASAVS